jgi:uncharacterized LabA/DUF88 family protein
MSGPSLCLLIDYQNIHLTARDLFAPPGTTAKATLVHPLEYARRLMEVRRHAQRDERQQAAELAKVLVYRGAPSNRHEPRGYAATQSQRAWWTRDSIVKVHYRTLRYPSYWPKEPAREKGIDVLLAINVVRLAGSGEYDILVLATHDTDLEPALEMAAGLGRAKIETAGWLGAKRLRLSGCSLWHTALGGEDFVATRDRRQY